MSSGISTNAEGQYLSSQNLKHILTNTATDTGFLFEVGNSAIGFSASFEAGLISLGVSSLCFSARASGEARKLGVSFNLFERFNNAAINNPLTRGLSCVVDKMSKNLGTSLIISGTALMAAAGFAASETADFSTAHTFYQSSREAVILGCFGLANAFRGAARGLKDGSTTQRVLDVAGITLASTGVIIAGQDINLEGVAALNPGSVADAGIKGSFIGAASMAAYQAIKALPSKGWLQPDILFACGCFGNAILSETPERSLANALFGIAFISLDALKKSGGVYERFFNPKPAG